MGITADDYKRVVNRNLLLEDKLTQAEKVVEFRNELTRNLLAKLDQLREDLDIRTAQYKQLLAFYNDVRERAVCDDNTFTLTWTNPNDGLVDTFKWDEDEDGLPIDDLSDGTK